MQQQRQLRLGDILDDYCPRERRVTNHAVVAMIGADVKQTRCTTCDSEHEYKHAKVPRQRRKSETPAALYAQVAANAPKRVAHETPANGDDAVAEPLANDVAPPEAVPETTAEQETAEKAAETTADKIVVEEPPVAVAAVAGSNGSGQVEPPSEDAAAESPIEESAPGEDEGPVHRPLIRASLPRPEGQPPQTRPAPEFTIRQPGGRPNRFRPRNQRGGGQPFNGTRSNGNVAGPRGMRPGGGGRPPGGAPSRLARRQGQGQGGRKRSK
jgi:hypothetical protein